MNICSIFKDITDTVDFFKIEGFYSSHSFRVSKINRLLKEFPIQTVSLTIGHKQLDTTMIYVRNYLSEEDKIKLHKKDDQRRYKYDCKGINGNNCQKKKTDIRV